MVIWPSGKAEDCKSFILQFESGYHLMKKIHIYIYMYLYILIILALIIQYADPYALFTLFFLCYIIFKLKKKTYIYIYT